VVTSVRRVVPVLLAVLLASVVAGCGDASDQPATAASVADPEVPGPVTSVVTPTGPKRRILLDPGHNGGNAQHLAQINRKVPDGRGGTKPCNTTGTSTDDGYPEYQFNWDVALRVRTLLITNGVDVDLTRQDDLGWGPCVDARGEEAAKDNADAEVSIHADGAAPAGHGFHVAYPKPPLNAAQGAPSLSLATTLRDAMSAEGLTISTYLGKQGLSGRSDLAGLNLSTRPVALVECANMRNPQEAEFVSNSAGRQRYANAIANGILKWLAQNPPSKLKAAITRASSSSSATATATSRSTSTSTSASTETSSKKRSHTSSSKPSTTEKSTTKSSRTSSDSATSADSSGG
jgi:N-acetylmuramoyl-L-alanine amidase